MAHARHKRETDARARLSRLATLLGVPVAFLLTASAIGAGVVLVDPASDRPASAATSLSSFVPEREPVVSRTASRRAALALRQDRRALARLRAEQAREEALRAERAATAQAVREADTRLWATEDLNLWTVPGPAAENVGLLEAGERVLVTGRTEQGRQEIVLAGRPRWVSSGYLSDEKPVAGVGGQCTNGTSVPAGVSPNIVKVHAAVCAAFPEITVYGTFRSDGEHAQGIAVDIMVSGSRGWEVAEFIRSNYSALGVSYLIYSQQIWSVQRGGEGWRYMADRGSVTANHYDHVHVTTY